MNERQRNELAFTYERFRRVGLSQDRELPTLRIERMASLAGAVREQLLRQVREADLHTAALHPQQESVPVSQELRERDLALIMAQTTVPLELAAIAYLEANGDLIETIMSLVDDSGRRAQLERGLHQRQAQLGLQVTTNLDEEAELSEERREVLREARRAFQRAANLVSTARDEQAARDAGANLPMPSPRVREGIRVAQEMVEPLPSLESNVFVGRHVREWRNRTALNVPLPNRMAWHPEPHLMATNHGPLSPKRSPRMTRGRELVLKSLRASMEELEEQVEACAIDEGTYHEKAMELKSKFDAVSSGKDDDHEASRNHDPNRPLAWRSFAERPEEVD